MTTTGDKSETIDKITATIKKITLIKIILKLLIIVSAIIAMLVIFLNDNELSEEEIKTLKRLILAL